ncbi:glycosyl hydrolase family 95 catalytic domain-containing protein [Bacteroides helcogenes]|uniref:Alpha-L-fucosidase n=1 Tax=Bacteroides helcogenes (strain ATCC 35417 / DSM 20613 / JCM 6297 / CCUG 15421 / P 36-108) TaxID=693979 RepID=E6SPA1_BACT6|nr:glycoside hydrolase family 95 protein [Bacteroides helcogenes]ADV44858.1 Alpha-L-fucosidase [Bacteroides helcogenes P 36-108]MDY5239715.1 glycoside hydrolase family 95 protein [Bacteroides helcogenes]
MKKINLLFVTSLFILPMVHAADVDYTKGLSIWFDTPCSLNGHAVWYGGKPDMWKGENKPETAGDTARNPDVEWESQSLPIGNGSIGASIMGSVEAERITFNEKTLWRGGPNTSKGADYYWNVNKQSAHVLEQIRKAFVEGDQAKAEKLTRENFNSDVPYEAARENPFRFGNFTTMGEFYVETGLNIIGMSGYKRALSLDSAMAVVQFTKDKVDYQRTYFISYPANVMVMRYTASRAGMQNLVFSYAPNPVSTGSISADGMDGLVYSAVLDNNGMKYVVRIHAVVNGGKLSNADGKLTVKGADEVVFYVTADTDYQINFDPDFANPATYVGVNPAETTRKWMDSAVAKGYDLLRKEHYEDYATLFNRVKLVLNPDAKATDLPTSQRLKNYRSGKPDYYLEELYYQFGRYLLIASSRPGNMPANLQGIWHNNVDGPWRVDYHNNINVQMNYWPACSTNLDECMEPLIDFIRTLVKPGKRTAQAYFGARGWTASISGNIFGFTAPLESQDMSWNFNPMAGPWLATHIWEYYDYTRDKKFLKETGYDLIKSSADFAVDYLWHKPDGTFTAAPSTSPEHGPVDQGTTFVHAVIREILLDAIEASRVLGVDKAERRQWEQVLARLLPYRIGRYGQLMEWSVDIDDPKDEHRHVNHLFGLHPGHTLSPVTTPELAQAARVVLEHRGDGATGWSMGWKLNQWARLQDGNHAYKLFGNLLKNGTMDNLWDTHPPFQIDGNFGGTAGVTEMLLQSHMGFIQLLPALPDAWHTGSVSGICAKGNFEVELVWKTGVLQKAVILSKSGGECIVKYAGKTLSFNTVKGRSYQLKYSVEKGLSVNRE